MASEIVDLEQDFRSSWTSFRPARYGDYLHRVEPDDQPELLTRLISADLEFAYQPPIEITSDECDEERIRPTLPLLLFHFPELRKHPLLLIRLAVLEYALRLRYDGTPPRPESYVQLCEDCPEHAEHLLQLLQRTEDKLPSLKRDHTLPSQSGANESTIRDESEDSRISLEPLPNNLGCFLLVDLISRGGMGFVYSAIDLRCAAPVAVKVMRRDDSWSIYRFIEEFNWLSQFNHPNLVRLYDTFADGDVRYFSMDLVEGRSIDEWFQRYRKQHDDPWKALESVLSQAASAIHFLHTNGTIHCDIKCSNLMINRRRRAILLDLGLAVREDGAEFGLGTLAYAAPEVIATRRHLAASDWYSFGLAIYQTVVGTFEPQMASDDDSERSPIDLKTLREQMVEADDQLVDLVCDLLHTDPNMRPSGADVVDRLGGSTDFHSAATRFTGRLDDIQALNRCWLSTREHSRSQLITLTGESGIGKSSLIEQWIRCMSDDESLILCLRCFKQDQTPLRLLNGLVQELVRVLGKMPTIFWRDALFERIEDIESVFPQIRQLVQSGYSTVSRSHQPRLARSESAATGQLMRWLVQLNAHMPFLIIVDDAQWADEASLRWLATFLRQDGGCTMALLVDESPLGFVEKVLAEDIQTVDPSAPEAESPLQHDKLAHQQFAVCQLDEATCRDVVNDTAQRHDVQLSEPVIERILAQSGGNPLLLQEVFNTYYYHTRTQVLTDAEWLQQASTGTGRSRFSMLPIAAETILQFLAVAGQPLGFHQLQICTRIVPKELQRLVDLLESQGWVTSRLNQVETDVEIAHERFQNMVINALPRERLQRRHARLARMLSSSVPPPWSRMGDHYWHAGQFRESAACYMQAARQAADTLSFREALQFIERASHRQARRNVKEAFDARLLEADCLAGIGSAAKSARLYESLEQETQDEPTAMLLACNAGEQWIRAGKLENGIPLLGKVLRSLEISNLQQTRIAEWLLWIRILRAIWFDPPNAPFEWDPKSFDSVHKTLNRISLPLGFLDNRLGPDLIFRLKKLTETQGSRADRAIAKANFGLLMSLGGRRRLRRAHQWLASGHSLAMNSEDPAANAAVQFDRYIVAIQQGKISTAARHIRSGLQWYSRDARNAQWEIQFLNWGQLGIYWLSMQLSTMREHCAALRTSAKERSDPMALFLMHVGAGHWADLASDDISAARASLETAQEFLENQSFQSPRFFFWLSQVHSDLYVGDHESAYEKLMSEWSRLDRDYVFRNRHYHWLALCSRICCHLSFVHRGNQRQRAFHRRKARVCIRRLHRLEHPAFVAHGHGFESVLRSAKDRDSVRRQEWTNLVNSLELRGHRLYANVFRWHANLYCPDPDGSDETSVAQVMHEAGAMNPEKLMNALCPLPLRD